MPRTNPVSFGPYLLDLDTGELRHRGRLVKLQPHASEMLRLLVTRAGELVTREEIRNALWGEKTFVNFSESLNTCMRQLRAALGDSSKTQRYIESRPKRGYRFVGINRWTGAAFPLRPGPVRATQKPRLRNRAERERVLILAAMTLFGSRGFAETTTAQIAAGAGCAEGLIHRYFGGKAGLLVAVIRMQLSDEVHELAKQPLRRTVQEELVRLVDWEVDHMWERRESLKVLVRQALVDPVLAQQSIKNGPDCRAAAIAARLLNYEACRRLAAEQLYALANSIGALAFMFGFLRPVFGQNRHAEKQTAILIARALSCAVDIPFAAPSPADKLTGT